MRSLFLETRGLSSFAVWRLCCRGCPCRLEMTAAERQWSDWRLRDSPSVRQSDGWETLSDRSGETRRNKRRGERGGGGGGKPGSFVFQSGEMWEVGQKKKKFRSAQVVLLVDDQKVPQLLMVFLRGIKGRKCAPLSSIKLVSIRCHSEISKIVSSRCESSHPEQI